MVEPKHPHPAHRQIFRFLNDFSGNFPENFGGFWIQSWLRTGISLIH